MTSYYHHFKRLGAMLPVGDAIETFSDFLPYITGEYGVCKYGSFDMARLELQDDHYIVPFVEDIKQVHHIYNFMG